MAEMIIMVSKFKKRYLKIAPKTGVVKPITSESEIINILRAIIIRFSIKFNFLEIFRESNKIVKTDHNSIRAIYFKTLPGSSGKGRSKLLINASGIFFMS